MMAGAASAQTNRTLSASELETARLGIYLRLAVERCGYKLRYNPIKSIYPGFSLWDVVSPESKKLLTDIPIGDVEVCGGCRPNACSAAWKNYGPQKRKGLWALVAADEPGHPGGLRTFPSQYSFIVCKDLKDLQTYLVDERQSGPGRLPRTQLQDGSCERIAAGTEISIDRRLVGGEHRYACYRIPSHRQCVWGPDLFR